MAKKITIEIDDAYASVLSLTATGLISFVNNVINMTCVAVDLSKTDYIKIDKSGKSTTESLKQKTDDVKPVKHGKWLDVCCAVKCSNCGEEYSDEIFLMRGNINYCPNCGAEMEKYYED